MVPSPADGDDRPGAVLQGLGRQRARVSVKFGEGYYRQQAREKSALARDAC